MGHTMGKKNDLQCKLEEGYSRFSKGQKKLADFIRKDYDKAAFLTAARMGEEVGVSESTVVRFAMALGYDGYPGFQKALGELVRMKLNSIQRMEVTYGRISQGEILATVLQSDIEKIKMTLAALDHEIFELAVETILTARKVYVIGIRSCAPLASFLAFYLNPICENVVLVNTNSSSEIFELSAVFHAHPEGAGICQQPEGEGHHADGQHPFSHDPLFFLQSDRQKRYGIHRGFSCSAPERGQCPCGGALHEEAG